MKEKIIQIVRNIASASGDSLADVADIFWLSFVEEGILNDEYKGYVGGRVEVYIKDSDYAVEEIRFFTNKKGWYKFREKWNLQNVTKKELDKIRSLVEERFYVA